MKADWITRIADRVEAHVRHAKGEQATIVCASGISPSGPIHLGNLREVMTVHLVAEELRSRGRQVDHVHSWDDYDRLRKIPANIPAEYEKYIGTAICDVPDPWGEYDSYVTRYISDFTSGLERLGIYPRYIRQSQAYRRGAYKEQIKQAMQQRLAIFDILAEHQTLEGQQETVEQRRNAYYPFRVYCQNCQKDSTQITAYDDATALIAYSCSSCGYHGSFCLDSRAEGKLVWKVDWPMRWSVEHVDFEPGGEDHSSPGSSYSVGQKIVQQVYHANPPYFVGYAFVGMGGRSKISSSAGTTATVSSALDIVEPAILRWLYARRANNQAFDIDYGQGLLRLYDEWDALLRQIEKGSASEANKQCFERATKVAVINAPNITASKPYGAKNCADARVLVPMDTGNELPNRENPCELSPSGETTIHHTRHSVPFSLLTSVMDVTQGNEEQVLRIISQHLPNGEEWDALRSQLEPRFTCALNWVTNYLPDDERTHIHTSFAADAYAQFPELDRAGIQMLVSALDNSWNLQGLTDLMYRIPKVVRGLPIDTAPNDKLKRAQRSFFIAIYTLICGSDTGPRIPTLLLSIGKELVKQLLSPSTEDLMAQKECISVVR